MAASVVCTVPLTVIKIGGFSLCSRHCLPILTPVRWTRYSPKYLEPTFRKEDLQEPLDERDQRKYQPIKAAFNEHTSSPTYDDMLGKLRRYVVRDGDKNRANLIVSKTFENIKLIQLERYHKAVTEDQKASLELDPRVIFHQAVENCKPLLITQKVKRGGVIYEVPVPIKANYQLHKALKWIIQSSSEKERNIRVWDKMAMEILDAYRNEGKSIRKKQELHRLCEANRAYAHYRW